MKTILKALLLSLTLLASLLFQGNAAHALYQVDPMRLMLTVPKGKNVVTASINITNPGQETVRLQAYTGYWTLDQSGALTLPDKPVAASITGNIRFNPREFELAPGGKQVVRLAFPLPSDAPDGEYHSIVYFEDLKTSEQRVSPTNSAQKINAVLTIKQRFAVLAYIYKGDIKPDPALNAYDCAVEQGKLKSALTLENHGARHYRGNGSFLLSRLDQATHDMKPIQEIPLEGFADIVVLPGSRLEIRQILLNEKELTGLEAGQYRLELNLAEKDNTQGQSISRSVDFTWNGRAPGGASPASIPASGESSGLKRERPEVAPGREQGGL